MGEIVFDDRSRCKNGEPLMSQSGQQRSSINVYITSAIIPAAARKQTFRDFAFVPIANSCSAASRRLIR